MRFMYHHSSLLLCVTRHHHYETLEDPCIVKRYLIKNKRFRKKKSASKNEVKGESCRSASFRSAMFLGWARTSACGIKSLNMNMFQRKTRNTLKFKFHLLLPRQ